MINDQLTEIVADLSSTFSVLENRLSYTATKSSFLAINARNSFEPMGNKVQEFTYASLRSGANLDEIRVRVADEWKYLALKT